MKSQLESTKGPNLKEISETEAFQLSGGKAAELIGLGLASALLAGYFGPLGMAYAYYNYFKD